MISLLESHARSLLSCCRRLRYLGLLLLVVGLASCSSRAAMEAEQAAAAQAEIARVAEEQARFQAEALEGQRRAEQARIEAERTREADLARARAEQERQQRDAVAGLEIERQQAIAQAQVDRQQKLARIASLQAQIATLETSSSNNELANARYLEAIVVAEELLVVLTNELGKYENVDSNGNTASPLAKERIAELEQRKNSLVQEAQAGGR